MKKDRLVVVAVAALGLLAGRALAQTAGSSDWDARAQEAQKHAEEVQKKAEAHAAKAEKWKQKHGEEGGQQYTERIAKTFKVGAGTALVLANIAGDITVSASAGDEIRLEAVKRARATTEADAQRQLEETRIDITERPGRVEARTFHKGSGKNKVAVDYVVTAPPLTALDLRSVAGDIVVDGIKGEVRAETVSGDVTATGLAKESSLKAVSGDVTVSASAVEGELAASSVSGDVLVKAFKARSISAGTVSGDVVMHSAACERALARSVNGNVELMGPILKGGRYEFKSHSGDIKLLVDGKTGFEVEASSFSGNIKTELPVTVQSQSDESRYGPPNRSLVAVYGDGSAQVEIASFSGNIIIAKKP